MGKQTLRKKISSKIVENKETVEYEYYVLEDFLTAYEIQTICDIHGDDPESAYGYGVAFDFDDDLTWINCDAFVLWAEDYLKDKEEDGGLDFDTIGGIKAKMEKYVAFDLWFGGE
jgi:hypothetical protein